jgi:hypothetical protein
MATDTPTMAPEDEAAVAAFNELPDDEQAGITALADAEGVPVEEVIRNAAAEGKSIEELAAERAEAGDEPTELPPMQLAIPGTRDRLTDKAGGARPTVSEARFMGASVPIDGQFEGEQYLRVTTLVKVSAVSFVFAQDDWGETKTVTRRHLLRAVAVEGVEAV